MTITKQPTGQDLVCLICHKQAQDIDHVVNRGMGGSQERDVPENKVPLCRECHDLKTLGRIETWTGSDTGEFVYCWRKAGADVAICAAVEVSERYKCLVLSAAAEARLEGEALRAPGSEESAGGEPGRRVASAAAPSAETGAGRAEAGDSLTDRDSPTPTPVSAPPLGQFTETGWEPPSQPLSDKLIMVLIAQYRREVKQSQWQHGDFANWLVKVRGEEAWQFLDELGYQPESLSNIMRVCHDVPPPFRNGNLRFSHHVVIAKLNREMQEEWLEVCVENGWSVAEFRRQVHGEKKRAKRWTLEELLELHEEWWGDSNWECESHPDRVRGDHGECQAACFLDWLEEGADDA